MAEETEGQPLFRGHPAQPVVAAAGAAAVAWGLSKLVPSNAHTYSVLQTGVAFLAIVVAATLQDGRFLSQTQQEVILFAGFGLLCFVLLVANRALSADSYEAPAAASADSSSTGTGAGSGGQRRAPQGYVVDEYYWY
ncbi:hypothetical protein BDY19DRAFT_903446 [Irpex rosettiformis]|uniref:Uncharacterized protein n=1 Tax=Irpex rosettiformis TaxID=378272 RepID=A0ACB8UF42_9APHY|nr:hypothetical protein BDY19DRAFT_903446 [Irpex rosettiformis]